MDKKKKAPTYKLNISDNMKTIPEEDRQSFLMFYAKVTRPTAERLAKNEGTRIELSTLRKLSDALEVPVQDLLIPVN